MPKNLGLAIVGSHASVLIRKLLREKEKREILICKHIPREFAFWGAENIKDNRNTISASEHSWS